MRPLARLLPPLLLPPLLLAAAACTSGGEAGLDAAPGDAAAGGDGPALDAGPGDAPPRGDAGPRAPTPLRINELVPDDDGFLIDEQGQTDDWVELLNAGSTPLDLGGYSLAQGDGAPHPLPKRTLAPGEALAFWADGSPKQGARHLPFKLPAAGGRVILRDAQGAIVDEVPYPALGTNESFARFASAAEAFVRCRYASPSRANGAACAPPPPPEAPAEVTFRQYVWPKGWGAPKGPLAITEAALRPARFVEVANLSAAPVKLDDHVVRLAPHRPGVAWPGATAGVALAWPRTGTLGPGERLALPVSAADVAAIAARPGFEGVVTVFARAGGAVVDRVDFLRVPDGASLARVPDAADAPGRAFAYCATATPGAVNAGCAPLAARDVGDRLRHLRADGDGAALARGGPESSAQAFKFLIDLEAGEVVHMLAARAWPMHYNFYREEIEGRPRRAVCTPADEAEFDLGWREYSDREYFRVEGRRFLGGTLMTYPSGLRTVEFDRGDLISGAQMKRAFFVVAAHVPKPEQWAVRPQNARQIEELRKVEGTVPIVDPAAPFRGITFQPLTTGVTFGVLRFIPTDELARARLGPDVIVVTDDVPNDVPLIGGLVTEAFQTPLSHVSILCRNRGTPNMTLARARADGRLTPYWGKLVRLEVEGAGFSIREATAAEAQAFWDAKRPKGERVVPRLDRTLRGPQELAGRSLDDLPRIGAKAAQLAELMRVVSLDPKCPGAIPTPAGAFAIPVVHALEHFERSGAAAKLAAWRADPAFAADPEVRARGLAEVRALIERHPVDADLLRLVDEWARARFAGKRFRLRSSSNTEDLPGFSGAGLYESTSAELDDDERKLEDGLRAVWASLWAPRAYDERELALIDHAATAMGVLVHEAFNGVERANGVAVSRDVENPTRDDVKYVNAQAGEASVTNPAPGVASEVATFTWWIDPPVQTHARSSLVPGRVLEDPEVEHVGCLIGAIHEHFQARIDPAHENRWFTMEAEFKLLGPERRLMVKQARPFTFGGFDFPGVCR